MASSTISPSQILEHRAARKAAGLTGCITGKPVKINFYGFSDVQSWKPTDPMNPHCFCFDCRETWDNDGSIDTELVKNGHARACETYASLLPSPPRAALPSRMMTGQTEASGWGASRGTWFPATPPLIEMPPLPEVVPRLSLPAPRHRDIMNETRQTRIKKDLLQLLTDFQGEMILVMDSRRRLLYEERSSGSDMLRREIDQKEDALWEKIKAAELLIETLDG